MFLKLKQAQWSADENNTGVLAQVLGSPVLQAAVSLVLSEAEAETTTSDLTHKAPEVLARRLAYLTGMRELVDRLVDKARPQGETIEIPEAWDYVESDTLQKQ